MEPSFSKEIPNFIGVYQIVEKIAEGGFGVVYKAFDPRLKRDVAIKVLHPQHSTEPTRVARFLREAQSAAKINHPNIVQIYDIVEEAGKLALVMEFVNGESLDKFIKHFPNLSLLERVYVATQIAEALSVAHELGIIHRDIKPANIIIDDHLNVKLTDFNLARLLDTSLTPLTGDHNVLGTPAYMSPEQCQGKEATAQSDIYSLGVVMYYLFTGSLPFEGTNYLALMRHHLETPPTPVRIINPNLPVSLEKLITQCLAKSPENRPSSAKEIAENLKKISEEITKKTTGSELPEQPTVVLRDTPIQTESPQGEKTPLPSSSQTPPSAQHTPSQGMPPSSPNIPPSHTLPNVEQYYVSPSHTQAPYQTPYTIPSSSSPYPYPQQQFLHSIPPTASPVPSQSELKKQEVLSGRINLIVIILLISTLVSTSVSVYLAYKLSTQPNTKINEELATPSMQNRSPTTTTQANTQPKKIEVSKILNSYAKEVDKNYNYRLYSKSKGTGYTAYFLELTSQSWHPEKTFPPVWRHWLTLLVPNRRTK
ncbi:MAG: protein kinase, partial [Candidatus Hydrogenedentes bacterium]|nr:protein kinase [Candidatus Hydrogenedentota bacterium]